MLLGELAALRAVTPPRAAGDDIELTPLALWALREQFALDGISVPLLAEPGPRMTAAALVALSGVGQRRGVRNRPRRLDARPRP